VNRIFDPFFTTKREQVGTGLGLSISRSILRRLGGDLLVDSVHGDGATFIAVIPRPEPAAVREAYMRGATVPAASASAPRATVLIVDDDERLLRAYARVLRDHCDVLLAADGQEAIDLLSSGSTADALIADLVLPELDGRKLHQWLTRERPALARATVFVTDASAIASYREFLASVNNPVLEKPASKDALLTAIARARDAARP
jgi:two-component system NtrC family sensor kinase